MNEPLQNARRVVLVTGPSGAGRSSALNALEDCGYEAVDNLPLRLLPHLLEDSNSRGLLALGVDPRNRDFSSDDLIDLIARLDDTEALTLELLYLDCRIEVLLRRFSETRRRHPLSPDDRPSEGIMRELDILGPLKTHADVLIDTSDLNIHELRAEIDHWFAPNGQRQLAVSVQSFSYKRGLPRSADMVFDCRFLSNPHWDPALRRLDGTDPKVMRYVEADARFAPFMAQVTDLVLTLLPAFREEGKSYLAVAFGCTGGQHRSVTAAQTLTLRLAEHGWPVSTTHRELDLRKKEEA